MSTWRMLVVVVGCVVTGMAAQACAPQEAASEVEEVVARSLPTFEVDEGWMKVPEQWKLGDASSFSSDSSGNIWLLPVDTAGRRRCHGGSADHGL